MSMQAGGEVRKPALEVDSQAIQREIHAKSRDLTAQFPEWMRQFDDCVMETAPRREMEELYASAPTEYLKGMVWGLISMRLFIASMTGVDFQ